jgi:DNA (cytosine-5)-methyltransferase 1
MWPAMADTIRELRPRFVIVENVASLLADRVAFGWILADLADLRFDAEWSLLSACSVGAPHVRERLFLVAYADIQHGASWLGTEQRPTPLRRSRDTARAWRDQVGWAVEAACIDDRDDDGLASRMVAHGGNAVVPQVAEHIGRMIMEAA